MFQEVMADAWATLARPRSSGGVSQRLTHWFRARFGKWGPAWVAGQGAQHTTRDLISSQGPRLPTGSLEELIRCKKVCEGDTNHPGGSVQYVSD